MKSKFTKNLGLKIISVFAAFFLWLVVVNVDDPIISRTYSNVPVEILNSDVIDAEGKCYEVLDNTDVINVVVTAKRSVLDGMSKDYIRATADFKALTFLDTVPIEVRSVRYADKIDSVTTRTENLKVKLEDVVSKSIPLQVKVKGEVAPNHKLAEVSTDVVEVMVMGPQSVIDNIYSVETSVDVTGVGDDVSVNSSIYAYDINGVLVSDDRVEYSAKDTKISILVNPIKQIPIASGYSGNPISGYAAAGVAMTDPSSVRVSGRGENYDDIDVIYISPDDVSIEGAMADVSTAIDITDYLPTGVEFADDDFNPVVNVTVEIELTQKKVISVPLSNIVVENIPEGYMAGIVDVGDTVEVEIQGLGDTFDRYSGDLAIGTIDAMSLSPRDIAEEGSVIYRGENDGVVEFDLPTGITVVNPVSLMVIVDSLPVDGEQDTSQDATREQENHEVKTE